MANVPTEPDRRLSSAGAHSETSGLAHRRTESDRKPRIGIMGGTFDPIHNGHLVAASEVAWALKLDEVIFVPTGNPSFKQDKHVTAAEHRYLMTVIATSQNPQFSVSRVDIDRPGVTYTIDTLRDLRKEFPDAELFFITGADAIAQMATWKDAEKLFSMAKFVAVGRPGYQLELGGVPQESVIKVEIPALAISSTDCRHRASIGEPLWYLVPDGVVRYIDKYALYRGENGGGEPDLPSARLAYPAETAAAILGETPAEGIATAPAEHSATSDKNDIGAAGARAAKVGRGGENPNE